MRHRTTLTAVVLAYTALAAAYTWPLLSHLSSAVPSDLGDPILNAAILRWNATHVPFSGSWWDAPHYYPAHGISAFTENLVGLWPLFTPVFWSTGSTIAAYNVAYFLTWPCSALAVFLLVRSLTPPTDAAFVAGLAFAFTPYRTAEISHLQSLSIYGLPVVLWSVHSYLRQRQRRWLLVFGVSWVLLSLTNGYYMAFGAVLLGMWLLYYGTARVNWTAAATILGTWTLASVPLVPVFYRYMRIHEEYGLARSPSEIVAYSATLQSWLEVTGDVWLWRQFLPTGKDFLFPGLTTPAILLVGAWVILVRHRSERPSRSAQLTGWLLGTIATLACAAAVGTIILGSWSTTVGGVLVRMRDPNRAIWIAMAASAGLALLFPAVRRALARRDPLLFYVAMVLVIAVLCLGPMIRFGDFVITTSAPYSWLLALPGFSGLRVVPRFWMLGVMCLSVAAGLVLGRLPAALPARTAVAVVASALVLVEGWMTSMRLVDPPEVWAAAEPADRPEPLLELPLGPDWDWTATYRAAIHGRRVVNGVSGYDPPHYIALRTALADRDPAALAALAALGPIHVIVDRTADPDGAIERYVRSAPGVTAMSDDGRRMVFELAQRDDAGSVGAELTIAEVRGYRGRELLEATEKRTPELLDHRLETSWADYPQAPGQWVEADLGVPREIATITCALGAWPLAFPQRVAIELSSDGRAWARVWEGDGAAVAAAALMAAPLAGQMRFDFPARVARYVKILQIGSAAREWRVAELRAHAPPPGRR